MTTIDDEKWVYWRNKAKQLEEENEKLKEIFIEQLESALTLSFVKEVYCNALLRILDENDSVEESKKFIKDYLGDD